jgi:effector-binding domain-containing protein
MKLYKIKFTLFIVLILVGFAAMIHVPAFSKENTIKISLTKIDAITFLGIRDSVQDMSKITEIIRKDYEEIGKFMEKYQIQWGGMPMTITISMADKKWDFIAAIPIKVKDIKPEGRITLSTVKAGKVVKGVMTGPYDKATPCYDKIVKFIREKKLNISGFSWEEYISDPAVTKPEKLITNIYFPVE